MEGVVYPNNRYLMIVYPTGPSVLTKRTLLDNPTKMDVCLMDNPTKNGGCPCLFFPPFVGGSRPEQPVEVLSSRSVLRRRRVQLRGCHAVLRAWENLNEMMTGKQSQG